MPASKYALILGATLAFLSVALGAFGAHAFKGFLTETERLGTYETAVAYQFYHALGLLLVGLIGFQFPSIRTDWVIGLMLIGILIFSGSLYLLCATGLKWLGAITPLGGTAFLVAWAMLVWKMWRGI